MLFYARMAHHAAVDLDLEPISRAVANLDALRRPLALGPALHAHLGGVGIGGVGLGGAGWQLAMGRGRSLGWGYVGCSRHAWGCRPSADASSAPSSVCFQLYS